MAKKPNSQESRWKRISKCIYNKEKKTFVGRTCKSWAQILVFYVCSYSFLAAFFYGMLTVFLSGYVDSKVPSLTGQQSLLRFSPGVGLQPRLEVTDTFFQVTNYTSSLNALYIEKAQQFLSTYRSHSGNADCSGGIPVDFPNIPCRFRLETLEECQSPAEAILNGGPCLYFRLNRVYGWLPELSNATIFQNAAIRCAGLNAIDNHLLGKPRYFPSFIAPDGEAYGSIPNIYFPYINQPGYQPPVVAVQFPYIRPSTVVLIECKLYGLKTDHSTVTFELSVDGKPVDATTV